LLCPKNIPNALTRFSIYSMRKKKSNYYGENSYYKYSHHAEIYLLSQFMCSTKDVHKRNWILFLTGFCVHLIPLILSLQFFFYFLAYRSIYPLFYFYLELTLKMTQIFL
jgi:hypothetical protein